MDRMVYSLDSIINDVFDLITMTMALAGAALRCVTE